jgi:Rap1a immunity proteins
MLRLEPAGTWIALISWNVSGHRLALRHVSRFNGRMPDSQIDFSAPTELLMHRLAISECAFVLLVSLFFGSARAEPDFASGNFMLPRCKHFTLDDHADEVDVWDGQCAGVISALMFVSTSLDEQSRFCPPRKATLRQAGIVVVNYMNAHPELLHLDFRGLAAMALREAWPCK